jgi:hypothetical protein
MSASIIGWTFTVESKTTHLLEESDPAYVRELGIEQEQIGRSLPERGGDLRAARGCHDLILTGVPEVAEVALELLDLGRLVVDEQDALTSHGPLPS